MRIVFMGSPDFSVPALDALIEAGHEVACVYCQPPRPAGRGKKDRPTAVQTRAEALGLLVRSPHALKTAEAQADFAALQADVAVVVAYGLILPQEVLDAPKRGCLNIHASLLPRWRGAAPIHRAVLAGDLETGVSIMQMDAGLDTGPVLLREVTPLRQRETTGEVHDRLAKIGSRLIVATLADLDRLEARPQTDEGATYAAKIDKAEALIDWTRPAEQVDRQIRGLSPFPGAYTLYKGERVKLLGSYVLGEQGAPGEMLGAVTVACGKDAVAVTRMQRAGRAAMPTSEALRGWDIQAGAILGE